MPQRAESVTHFTQVASSESVRVLIEIGLGQVEDRPEYGFTPIGKNVCLLKSCSDRGSRGSSVCEFGRQ